MNEGFLNVIFTVGKYGHIVEVWEDNLGHLHKYKLWLDFDEKYHWDKSKCVQDEIKYNEHKKNFMKLNSRKYSESAKSLKIILTK